MKQDILKEPVLKQALINHLMNSDYFSEFQTPPALRQIILTRYNANQMKELMQNECSSQSYLPQDNPNAQNQESQSKMNLIDQDGFFYKASDGFQQIDVIMNLKDSSKPDSFKSYSKEELSQKQSVSLFTVIIGYEFTISTNEGGLSKRQVQMKVSDFFVHSMHERLSADILQPPDNLPHLHKDPEIITYYHYVNHREQRKKALQMKGRISEVPQVKIEPIEIDTSAIDEHVKGIEPIINVLSNSQFPQVPLKDNDDQQQRFERNLQDQDNQRDVEGDESPVEVIQTESEDYEDEEQKTEAKDENNGLNDKINMRIKQLLGASFNKSRIDTVAEKVKSGRGKWHYTGDQKYGFNVSYANGDTVISMGQVFIIQTPKVSISSKYRGYPIPVIEPPPIQESIVDFQINRIQRPKCIDLRQDSSSDLQMKNYAADKNEEQAKISSTPAVETCVITKGSIFAIHTYLSKEEVQHQISNSIQQGLKYEEEYLSGVLRQQQLREAFINQQRMQYLNEQAASTSINTTDQNQYGDQSEGNTYQEHTHEYENNESYMSDSNYQQYGLESVKTPFKVEQQQHSQGSKDDEEPQINLGAEMNPKLSLNQNSYTSFFVDSKYFGHSKTLKKAFKIKNTVMKIFKYGTKDLYRFSNATFIERHDEQENAIKQLRSEPEIYGNQKRKRMLKYFDRVQKLIYRVQIPKNEKSQSSKKNQLQTKELWPISKQDIDKFVSWYRYTQTRFYYSSDSKTKISTNYNVSNFFGFTHNFSMRLTINVERPKKQHLPVIVKQEYIEKQSTPEHHPMQHQVPSMKNGFTMQQQQVKEINVPTIEDYSKKHHSTDKAHSSFLGVKKLDIEIPIFQEKFMNLNRQRTTQAPPSQKTNHRSYEYDQKMKYEGLLYDQKAAPAEEDEERLLRDFCQQEPNSSYRVEYEPSEQQLLLEFNKITATFNNHNNKPNMPQSSQCDFTVQLSENEEENSFWNPREYQETEAKFKQEEPFFRDNHYPNQMISNKQLQQLLKNNIISDEVDFAEKERETLLQILRTHPIDDSEDAFLAEIDRLSDLNLWKVNKVDIAQWYEVFNAIDEILEKVIVQRENRQIDNNSVRIEGDQSQSKLIKVLKFLRIVLQRASNVNFFNSTERLTKLYTLYEDNFPVLEELVGTLIILSSKQHEKPGPQQSGEQQQTGLESFNSEIKQIMQSVMSCIRCFEFIADLLINANQAREIDFRTIISQNLQALQKEAEINSQQDEQGKFKSKISELSKVQNLITDQKSLEDAFCVILKYINLYLNMGDMFEAKDKYEQTTKLQELLPPKMIVNKFIQILKSSHLGKKVHVQVSTSFFIFTVLDLMKQFNYGQPTDNLYYVEACNHHEFYIHTIQQLARYHAYEKLKAQGDQQQFMQTSEFESFIAHQHQLLGEDEFNSSEGKEPEYSETIKSQRFFNNFMNYICNLLNIKNRALTNQLYPQFLKPLLAIINVPPIGNQYPININIQLKAAKLLKDVVKMSSLDDPGAVEIVVERLRQEIKYLYDDESKWHNYQDDDSEQNILQIYRQDLVRTFLRFLSYSIIRNDPNAVNFAQNFVANSRKILDSNLLQVDMINHVFYLNKTLHQEPNRNAVESVIHQCIQLISYLFNDLPQKIPQFIENGFFGQVLDSLSTKIAIQPDMIIFIMKLIQTLCLNSQGVDLVVNSKIIETFVLLVCDPKVHKQFVNPNKAMLYKDLIQQVAVSNKQIALQFYQAIVKSFDILKERAWDVTKHYIEMERKVKTIDDEIEKNKIKFIYERDQVNLELTFESATNILWFYGIDEQVYGANNFIHQAIIESKDLSQVFLQVIATPIVASACPNMFPAFIEIYLQLSFTLGVDHKIEIMNKILSFINLQCDNIQKLIKTQDYDAINDLETSIKHSQDLVLDELQQESETSKTQMIYELKGEDQASVVFGKLSFYCEIIYRCQQQVKTAIMKNEEFINVIQKLFKIQSLINRYHASKYEKDILKDRQRLYELLKSYSEEIKQTDFTKFQLIKEPKNDEEEAKNLYFKYEAEKIRSLTDFKNKENAKTVIELQLDENISHTSNMCQISIRKLLTSFLKFTNRKKIHFSERVEPIVLRFNKLIGNLIAEEFEEFRRLPPLDNIQDSQIMKYCCQFSAVFSEFNKILFGNFSYGILLIQFINKKGIQHVQGLIMWLLQYLFIQEKSTHLKSIGQFKNIQLLWSHLIDFFVQMIDGKYLDIQFHQFLISFKPNPLINLKLNTVESKQLYEDAVSNMKKYFMNVFTASSRFLFIDLNECKWVVEFFEGQRVSVFEYFDQTSELFFLSLLDAYAVVTRGLQNVKLFSQNYSLQGQKGGESGDKQSSGQASSSNVRQLVEMGFPEDKARYALDQCRNNIEEAIEMITTMPFFSPTKPQTKESQPETKEEILEEVKVDDDLKVEIDYGNFTKYDLYRVVSRTIRDFIKFKPTNPKQVKKCEILDSIFFKLGVTEASDSQVMEILIRVKYTMLEVISEALISQNYEIVGILSYCLNCLICYKRGQLINTKETFTALFEIVALLQTTLTKLKEKVSVVDFETKQQQDLVEFIKQIDITLQLFLYVTEEGKISSDLNKLSAILDQQSSLADNIKIIQDQLDEIQKRNSTNMFFNNKDQTAELYQKIAHCIIDLFKSLHQMNPSIEQLQDSYIHELILKSLETLNFLMNIKGFADFDCQSYFLQNEGLRALFGIRSVCNFDKVSSFLSLNERKRTNDIQIQSKILLQMLCQNDQSQIKVYENLIKSILFIQFQEKYKKEEGQDLKNELLGSLANAPTEELIKVNQQSNQKTGAGNAQAAPHSSKKKYSQTPIKKAKTDEKLQQDTVQKTTSKQTKQFIHKKAEYGEVLLEEFIQFFNNVMQVQDFKSFLIACQNVCIIKKKKLRNQPKTLNFEDKKQEEEKKQDQVKDEDKKDNSTRQISTRRSRRNRPQVKIQEDVKKEQEEKIEEQEKYYIMLNHQSLKEMLQQYENLHQQQTGSTFNLPLGNDYDKIFKGQMQKFQQEIIFTLLDQFIDHIRDQQLFILQQCKQSQNPSAMGVHLGLNEKGQLMIKDNSGRFQYQSYLFDIVCILSHLTYLLTHTPILVTSLIKHKEGKTFKFIIRNLYFLMTLSIRKIDEEHKDQFDYLLFFEHKVFVYAKKKLDIVLEFFKRVMFDNPHLTLLERKVKQEARSTFQKEILKNLSEFQSQKQYQQWQLLRHISNTGALWLLGIVLKDEDKEDVQQDKKLETLVVNMQKYRNIYRNSMIKSMIFECQVMQSKSNNNNQLTDNTQIALIKIVERIQTEMQERLSFFENFKDPVQICIQALSNILKPFENNKHIWGDKEKERSSILSESNLGFMPNRHNEKPIDEEMNEEDDEDEDEDDMDDDSSSSDDDDQMEEDDDLLDSEVSERNFRFSQHEPMDEEYGDEEDDDGEEDESDDDNDDDDGSGHGPDLLLAEGEEPEDFLSGEYSEDAPANGLQLIGDLLGGNDIELIDYGNEGEEDDDESYQEESYLNRNQGHDNAGPQSQGNQRNRSLQGQAIPDSNQQQNDNQQDQRMNDNEGGDQDDQDYGEDDDYNSEDEEEEPSEEYYDEEIDDDEQEIQIYVGNNPGNMERLSLQDLRGPQGQRIFGNMQRRDDVMSLNNLSVDHLNLHLGGGHSHHDQNFHPLNEATEEVSVDFSQLDHRHDEGQPLQPQVLSRPSQQNGIDVIDDLIGLIMGNNRQRQPKGKSPTGPQEEDVAYKPFSTLMDVLAIGKEMQRSEQIYRLFIKEINENNNQQLLNQRNNDRADQEQQNLSNTDQEVISTKSQFSTKNPFKGANQPKSSRGIFGQFDNNSFNPKKTGNQQQIEMINTNQSQQRYPVNQNFVDNLDIDPEFFENLDDTALQNIAETENLIQFISNQSRQSDNRVNIQSTVQLLENIRDQSQRAQIFRDLAEEAFNALPSNLFSEGLQYRASQRIQPTSSNNQQPQLQHNQQQQQQQQQQSQQQPNQPAQPFQLILNNLRPNERAGPQRGGQYRDQEMRRGRLMSLDSQLNDLADFSRQHNDPFFRSNNHGNSNKFLTNFIQDFSNKNNTIFVNFSQYLQDQIIEMGGLSNFDQKGQDLDKACEQILQQFFTQNQDSIDQSYQKIQGLVDMVMVWIKVLTNGVFISQKEQNLMRVLFKVPLIRLALLIKTLHWFQSGIRQLEIHQELHQKLQQRGHLKFETVTFQVDRGVGLTGKIELNNFIFHVMRCFKQFIQESSRQSISGGLDILKIPKEDQLLKGMIQLLGLQTGQQVSLEYSIFDQMLDCLLTFYNICKDRLYLLNILDSSSDNTDDFWIEDTISNLTDMFRKLSQAYKLYQESQDTLPEKQSLKIKIGKDMIDKLGAILLTQEFKSKVIQKDIKTIFNEIATLGEGNILIEEFFKDSLSQSLKRFIDIISNPQTINTEKLKKEVIIITQILKIARSNTKQESNIVDEDLFFRVVKEISFLIDRKQVETQTLHHASFMFKEEFRTVMIALFILFEYNLKFIFTDSGEESLFPSKRRSAGQNATNPAQRRAQAQQQQQQQQQKVEVIMQDIEEIKHELQATTSGATQSKDKSQIMEAIEEHLRIKIKDQKAREDKRLKIFIKFCLEHKKVINSFIRANQQVLNESLRNVLMKVPQILDFDNKRIMFRGLLKKIQKKFKMKYIDIQVRRDKVFEDSYEQLKHIQPDRWKGQLNLEFVDEQGIDEGGLTREWFILLSQEIFNPDLAMFIQSNAGSSYYPNPKSVVHPEYVSLFKFIGRIVGKAVYEQQLLDCYFVKALYKILLGLPLTYHDVEDFDNELYKNLKWCLEHSVDGLGLTFTETQDYFGKNEEIEIIEGGKDLEVTDDNKFDYVQRMAYQKLYKAIQKQVDAFLQGFHDIVPRNLIQLFDNRELELLISGLPNIDIMDLKENTIYQNYSSETPVVKWLFEVLEEFDNSERAEFLQFVTGSSKVPVEGFKGLRGSRGIQKFQVVKFFTNDTNRLPQAHTCFKQLELPEYSSKEQLKERLLTAIKEGKTFGFA